MKLLDISTPKHPNTFTMVDDEDYDFLNQWKWCAYHSGNTNYAKRSVQKNNIRHDILIHRLLLGVSGAAFVDHINRNGLDNRKENLRVCTISENGMNCAKPSRQLTSKYKGVYFHKRKGKFNAKIKKGGKNIHLGTFTNETDAAIAYNSAARELFGDFARINEIN